MERRKELKEQYKQMKPEMGVFAVYSKNANKWLVEATPNLKGSINRYKFQLEAGRHPNRKLQNDWQEFGGKNFEFEILEILEYDKDESKTDYSEELALLKILLQEKFSKENKDFY